MSSNTPVTVELVGENLRALLGEMPAAGASAPPLLPAPSTEASPRLVDELPAAAISEAASRWAQPSAILKSAKRPLFTPLASDAPEAGEPASEPENETPSNGLVLYQAPPPSRRAYWMAAAGVALVLSGFAVYAYTVSRRPSFAVVSPGADDGPVAQAIPASYAGSPLKLQLETRDHSLVAIRWDPQAAPLGKASSGRLLIMEDGAEARVVPLDANQLKIGHLYLDTAADRVEFRLEVTDGSGNVTKESLLALAMPSPNPSKSSSAAKTTLEALNMKSDLSKPSPTSSRIAESLKTIDLNPPSDTLSAPGYTILASVPQTFGQFAPSAPVVTDLSSNKSGENVAVSLLHQVAPVYPARARAERVQGIVRFTATISKEGKVKSLQMLSGNPLLVDAASEAAKQWLYSPMRSAGKPVDSVAQIAVDFSLN